MPHPLSGLTWEVRSNLRQSADGRLRVDLRRSPRSSQLRSCWAASMQIRRWPSARLSASQSSFVRFVRRRASFRMLLRRQLRPRQQGSPSMKLTDFKALTFDCYGTLIDWESGMTEALKPLTSKVSRALTRNQILEAHARHKSSQQVQTPAKLYRELLPIVHRRLAEEWGVSVGWNDCVAYGRSVKTWPTFADSAPALHHRPPQDTIPGVQAAPASLPHRLETVLGRRRFRPTILARSAGRRGPPVRRGLRPPSDLSLQARADPGRSLREPAQEPPPRGIRTANLSLMRS